jgi:hypothetical protein
MDAYSRNYCPYSRQVAGINMGFVLLELVTFGRVLGLLFTTRPSFFWQRDHGMSGMMDRDEVSR